MPRDREDSSRSRSKSVCCGIARIPRDPGARAFAAGSRAFLAIQEQQRLSNARILRDPEANASAAGSQGFLSIRKQERLLRDRVASKCISRDLAASKRSCSSIARTPRDPGANAPAPISRGILAIPQQTLLLLHRVISFHEFARIPRDSGARAFAPGSRGFLAI